VADPELVAKHYGTSAFDFETTRLTELCPVEFAITKRMLDRWIPDGALVADIGVGAGHYAEHLAARGCRIHLIDVTERLLDLAAARLESAGLAAQLAGVTQSSATDLSGLATGSVDAVMMLGPLYHLRALDARRRAVEESATVLKPGGVVYAAGINRLPYFRDLFCESPRLAAERREFHKQFLEDGNLDPDHAPPLGFAHLTTVQEFRELFAGVFEPLILVGVESFTAAWQPNLLRLSRDEADAWLDLVEQTGVTPEGLGASDHFLFVGRKPGATLLRS
jgi:S-adenosylmethionine-dependent methyltransferase